MLHSSFWRHLILAVPCVLLLTLILPLTAFAKPLIAAQTPGPLTVTTDAPCSSPTNIVHVGLSSTIPEVTVTGTATLTSSDPNEASQQHFLKLFDTSGTYYQPVDVFGQTIPWGLTVDSGGGDTILACILPGTDGNGPDGDELGTITFKGTVTQYYTNYAGYASAGLAASSLTYSRVQGSWTVPTAQGCSFGTQSQAGFWVGLGGVPNGKAIEQIATVIGCARAGNAVYQAEYEMFPASPQVIDPSKYPINPGDTIQADVQYIGNNFFILKMNDSAWTQPFAIELQQAQMDGALISAEWIAEATGPDNKPLYPLTNFGTVNFSGCTSDSNPSYPINIGPATYKVEMVKSLSNPTLKSQPSDLTNNGTAFSVTWQSS